jgi:FkbM family methyltransferase
MRRVIWRTAQARQYDGPIVTSWSMGQRFNHHLAGDMSQCTFVDGRYEPNEMYALSRLLRPGMCVFDVGANAGVFTLLAAALVGEGVVYAFEPSPRDRTRLVANVRLNALSNVRVRGEGLGSAVGKATLAVASAEHPGHNTLGGFVYSDDAAYSVDVDVVTLDSVVAVEGLLRLDVLKIDVEGAESAVLRGATAALRRFRPIILVEAQDTSLREAGSSLHELLGLLRDARYDLEVFGSSGLAEPLVGDEITGLNLLCLPREE